ncbi:allantoinase AllB [Lutispora sp.]|uniref:allantoinase AllB n=1 Tax=Lutispora sp. TaxID=2828727 RepID=UPI002B20EF0E|nr:allantoinase AllB [Lutispora sp.]MEA4961844.1 allantoinase AllB [Lutispora sp.]
MSIDLLIKNAMIPKGDTTVKVDILVDKGIIVGFMEQAQIQAKEIIDACEKLVIPGCIDSHTHINDPGFTHRENFLTGTSAAASGGVTTIIDMPCCSVPSVRSVDNLEYKLSQIADKAIVDYGMWGGVTGEDVRNNWLHNVKEQADYGVCAFKVYMTPSVPTYPRVTDPEMLEAFKSVAATGLPIGIHAENYAMCDFYVQKLKNEGRLDGPAWAEARLELAEKVAIELGISLAEFTGARLHIVHMSTGIGAVLVKNAKMRGLDVTSETCPHYLTINYQDAMSKYESFAKIAPPLRTVKDNEMLWEGVTDGSVDFIATDHAPYEISTEKCAEGMNIWNSFPGIPGVETMVPVIVSEGYNKGKISLSRMVEILCKNPAIHYGLYPKKGSMEIGSDADFTIIDLDKEWTIEQEKMYTMAKYTPLHGMTLKGKPVKTIVRGSLVYEDGKGIIAKPGYGRFVKRQTISKLPRQIKF